MTRLLLVALFALTLTGCAPTAPSASELDGTLNGIRYIKDPKSGLCFAALASNNGHIGNIVSIANVPCSAVSR